MNKNTLFKNRKSANKAQVIMDNQVIKLFKSRKLRHLVIIILFKGKKLPQYGVPMPRDPSPKINIPLNNNLAKVYFSVVKKNPSAEDGAILIQETHSRPILKGVSYRIYPPPLNVSRSKNMGAGYNSALDFSGIEKVTCVYYINKKGVIKLINGKETVLC